MKQGRQIGLEKKRKNRDRDSFGRRRRFLGEKRKKKEGRMQKGIEGRDGECCIEM